MNGLNITVYKVGELQTNCYVLSKDSNCLIFDLGDSADFVLEQLSEKRLKPIAVFATHGHFDHVLGVGELQLSYDIPLYISNKDLFLLDRALDTAEFFLKKKIPYIPPKNIKDLKNGILKVSSFEIDVVITPGHTPGSTCFNFTDFILTGDTLFKGTVGRYDFSYSSKRDLLKSIIRLYELADDTLVYPGHEDETTIGQEKKTPII